MNYLPLAAAGALGAAAALAVIISGIVQAFFLWLGGRLAGVTQATFGRAILIAALYGIIAWLALLILAPYPLMGLIVAIVILLFLIKSIFATTWAQTFGTWLLALVAQIIVAVIFALTGFFFVGARG